MLIGACNLMVWPIRVFRHCYGCLLWVLADWCLQSDVMADSRLQAKGEEWLTWLTWLVLVAGFAVFSWMYGVWYVRPTLSRPAPPPAPSRDKPPSPPSM